MRLVCLQKDLANALNITNKAVSANNTLPVLNNVLVKAEGKKLYFTTTNLEIAINYWIDAEIKNEGEITIPSRLFTNYVGYLKDEKVDITIEEGEGMLLKTSDSKIKIKGISANEFPSIPIVEKESGFKTTVKDLDLAIKQVVFAAAFNTTRPILTGVYFSVKKNELKMAATDSYRLAEKTLKVKDATSEIACIVPGRTMLELGAILGLTKEDIEVEVVISKNQIFFNIDKTKITSRLIDGQFPNYQQVIPQNINTKISLNTQEFSLALKRINLLAKENNNKVLLKAEHNNLIITTDTTQYGAGEVEIKTKIEGDAGEIALNSQFVLDVLSNINSGDVVLGLSSKTMPATIQPKDKSDYIHIVMPLKI